MSPTDRLRAAGNAEMSEGMGLTQMAASSGMGRSNLARFLRGECGVTLDLGVSLATVLGVDLHGQSETGDPPPKIGIIKAMDEVPEVIEKPPEPSKAIVPAKPPRIVDAVPVRPPAKRAMSPAEIAKRKKLGMPID